MSKNSWRVLGFCCLLAGGLFVLLMSLSGSRARAQSPVTGPVLTGSVYDEQGQAVEGARVSLWAGPDWDPEDTPLIETTTQPDGSYALCLRQSLPHSLLLHVERAHFEESTIPLPAEMVRELQAGNPVAWPDIALPRQISVAFWIAALVFAGMLVLIAAGKLHNTLAALLGAVTVLAVSYAGYLLWEDLFIFDFPHALGYVDWNVIFLIMGMMIFIAVVERTGIFQWLAFFAYRISGGRLWLLLPILMLVAGVASALLDNVTTMLLMTPITIQIALAMDTHPLALLMPEVMASNVAGVSTLVGTPTNILIGSYAQISFNAFLRNLTPGVVLALIGLIIYSEWAYRKDLRSSGEVSKLLLAKLEERAQISQPGHLKKAGWVGLGMLILFVLGESFHLTPAVTALIGSTVLLLWIRPDVEEMIEAVDWTTLVFFIALFITVGAIQEVGLISMIASLIGRLVGGNLVLSMLAVIWISALLSTVVANIPFTAAMLPVVGYLTAIVPGAEGKVLFYCLSIGSAMGGNGSLIGASANMVTAGIAERAGFPVSYLYFIKRGMPALLITVALATLWLLLRFLVLG
ncbi:MAG: citrate transporter [Chloroflexia bacterium]|nr:citrate transporter [Chloroflexia bacterium]